MAAPRGVGAANWLCSFLLSPSSSSCGQVPNWRDRSAHRAASFVYLEVAVVAANRKLSGTRREQREYRRRRPSREDEWRWWEGSDGVGGALL